MNTAAITKNIASGLSHLGSDLEKAKELSPAIDNLLQLASGFSVSPEVAFFLSLFATANAIIKSTPGTTSEIAAKEVARLSETSAA